VAKDPTLPKTKLDQAREQARYGYENAVSSGIRVALAKTGLDSAEIARRCGMNRATIYRFMVGERSMSLDALDQVFRSLELEVEVRVWGREVEGQGALESAKIKSGDIIVKGISDYEERTDGSSASGA
jgi:putative ATPase subunit gpP of terminase